MKNILLESSTVDHIFCGRDCRKYLAWLKYVRAYFLSCRKYFNCFLGSYCPFQAFWWLYSLFLLNRLKAAQILLEKPFKNGRKKISAFERLFKARFERLERFFQKNRPNRSNPEQFLSGISTRAMPMKPSAFQKKFVNFGAVIIGRNHASFVSDTVDSARPTAIWAREKKWTPLSWPRSGTSLQLTTKERTLRLWNWRTLWTHARNKLVRFCIGISYSW